MYGTVCGCVCLREYLCVCGCVYAFTACENIEEFLLTVLALLYFTAEIRFMRGRSTNLFYLLKNFPAAGRYKYICNFKIIPTDCIPRLKRKFNLAFSLNLFITTCKNSIPATKYCSETCKKRQIRTQAHPGPTQLTFRAIQWSIIVTLLVVQNTIGEQTTASIIHRFQFLLKIRFKKKGRLVSDEIGVHAILLGKKN